MTTQFAGEQRKFAASLPEEGVKYDGDKNRLELIPPEMLTAIGSILTFGAEKYADRNWEKGQPLSRYLDSQLKTAIDA